MLAPSPMKPMQYQIRAIASALLPIRDPGFPSSEREAMQTAFAAETAAQEEFTRIAKQHPVSTGGFAQHPAVERAELEVNRTFERRKTAAAAFSAAKSAREKTFADGFQKGLDEAEEALAEVIEVLDDALRPT
jgi:hypothetical protein